MHMQAEVCPGDHIPRDVLSEATGDFLGKALLKRFADSSESVRALAVKVFHHLITSCPDTVLPMLPYATPVLEERLQMHAHPKAPVEPSEEMRLSMIQVRPPCMRRLPLLFLHMSSR